jgi:hypothetical protein
MLYPHKNRPPNNLQFALRGGKFPSERVISNPVHDLMGEKKVDGFLRPLGEEFVSIGLAA